MLDFPMKESSIWTSLYCLVFYLIILKANFKIGLKYPMFRKVSNKRKRKALILIGLFFITHCLRGDFFHFMEVIHEYSFTAGSYNYGEEIYQVIAKVIDKNYFIFRTIIWGGSLFLFCLSAKRIGVPIYFAVVFLFACYSITFAYARVTVSMAIYFYALSLLCYPLRNFPWGGYVIGILLIYCSLKFHNSAILMALMTIMIFIPINKWSIIIIVSMIPFLGIVLQEYLFAFVFETSNATVANKIVKYTTDETEEEGLVSSIISCIQLVSFYIPFVINTICFFFKNKLNIISKETFRYYRVTFGLTIISFIFFFLGESFWVFSYRILFMTMIPLTLITIKLYSQGLLKMKYFCLCYLPGICFNLLRYFYDVYVSYVS